ncbi:response regulator, partial [candidate division KSB1 bacterium]
VEMEIDISEARVLIVDDTPDNIKLLGSFLKPEGYRLNIAQNGKQALDVVNRVKPDLILLDVMMPVLDGHETCKQLKSSPETENIPVIFLTGKTEIDDIIKGFELGAVDYLAKPVIQKELLVRVKNHLELKMAKDKLAQI